MDKQLKNMITRRERIHNRHMRIRERDRDRQTDRQTDRQAENWLGFRKTKIGRNCHQNSETFARQYRFLHSQSSLDIQTDKFNIN